MELEEFGVDALDKSMEKRNTVVTQFSVMPKSMVGTVGNQVELEVEARSSASDHKKIVFRDLAIVETLENKAKRRKIAADIICLQKLAKTAEKRKQKRGRIW